MLNYLELLDRANQGAYLSEENWDLERVSMATRRLVRKYKLAWDPNRVVPNDPGLADAVFAAGFELACELGVYVRTNERIVQFDRSELEQGLRLMPQNLEMGEGKDARRLFPRKIMDERPPLVWAGNPGAPTPEEIFLPMVMSWMQEPIVDLVTCGTLTRVDGREVRTGDPMEIVATRRELQARRTRVVRGVLPGVG